MAKAQSKIIGSVDDLKRAANKVYGGSKPASDLVDNLLFGKDKTGSFILDCMVAKSNKKTGKMANGIKKVQRKAADLDMKAGAKMHDIVSKGLDKKEKLSRTDKIRKGVANSFVKEYTMDVSKPKGTTPGMQAKVNAGSLTEPMAKAKNKVIPFVGSATVTNALLTKYKKQEGGEDKVASNNIDDLIEKIAGCKPTPNKVEKVAGESDKDALLLKAHEMLKMAATKVRQLETYCEKLAIENQNFHLDLLQRDRHDEAVKIANEMHSRGLIKKADIDEKIEDISAMDDESLALFKKAMEDVVVPQSEGVSDLTFILDKDNIRSKETMIDVFSK